MASRRENPHPIVWLMLLYSFLLYTGGGVVSCGCDNPDGGDCRNKFPQCPAFTDPGLNFGNGKWCFYPCRALFCLSLPIKLMPSFGTFLYKPFTTICTSTMAITSMPPQWCHISIPIGAKNSLNLSCCSSVTLPILPTTVTTSRPLGTKTGTRVTRGPVVSSPRI